MAAHGKVTTRHLPGVFKGVLNITVNDYNSIAKMDNAMRCLTESEMSIAQITSRLGPANSISPPYSSDIPVSH